MSDLTDRQYRLLRADSPEGRLFREGAACEARARQNLGIMLHRELVEYVRQMAEHHTDWTDAEIAEATYRVFSETDNARRVGMAARIELDRMVSTGDEETT